MAGAIEVNFDGLVGNTHNYAGLSYGNVASTAHQGQTSSPRAAALQGLAKMKSLADMGLTQGVLPPHVRPCLSFLRHIGFGGEATSVLRSASAHRHYLNTAYSASSMWVANAATVAPSADSADGRVHFTPANLASMLHRSIEHQQTAHALQQIFKNSKYFVHHDALKAAIHRDEGAANHTRFCRDYGDKGVHFFVYGQSVFLSQTAPRKFPARQTKEACEAIARLHQLNAQQCVFAQQNPKVIDTGVFHNDVISVGNQQLLFTHEKAFANQQEVYEQLRERLGAGFEVIEVAEAHISVEEAVASYLFNSQLVSTERGMVLIAPSNCQENPRVKAYIKQMLAADNRICDVKFFTLQQSMVNGGGPACLRLRVVLSADELAALSGRVILDQSLYADLVDWVNRHYRDALDDSVFADTALLHETQVALTELSTILALPELYTGME